MNVDQQLIEFYDKRIKQVFVYITSRCQLHCRQCLYKPLLCRESQDIDYDVLQKLLSVFYSMGAYKVSFLGGEPTLYHNYCKETDFTDVIKLCKKIGYQYVRFDTNGQFSPEFLDKKNLTYVDEITFSLDGFNKETNDVVRGRGSFDNCVQNIKRAVQHGFKVQITMCVHKAICTTTEMGLANIEKMISFATSLGVSVINFHPILKVGIARDNWIDDTNIDPYLWMQIYSAIQKRIDENMYAISVRMPMRFVERQVFENDREKYSYCPLQLGERALIMPDGTIKVCAFTIGTPYHLADYSNSYLKTYIGEYSEYSLSQDFSHSKDRISNCLFQKIDTERFVPLCMSYKPNQKEIVWNDLVSEVCR